MSTPTTAPDFGRRALSLGLTGPFRLECDLRDCEVEGRILTDLRGSFYRVGPDFQYPPRLPNIPFDGEGHLGMFRFATVTSTTAVATCARNVTRPRPRRAQHCSVPIATRKRTIRASKA